MNRIEELKAWFANAAPLGQKFPLRIDGFAPGHAEVSMEVQLGDLVSDGNVMIMQGGILAVIADAAAVLAAMSTLGAGHTPLAHISYDLLSKTTLLDFRLTAVANVRTQTDKWIWVDVTVYGASSALGDNMKAVVTAKFAKPKTT